MFIARHEGMPLPIALRVMQTPVPENSEVHEATPPLEDQPAGKKHKHRTFTPIERVSHRFYKRSDYVIEPADDLQKLVPGTASLRKQRKQLLLVLSATGIALLGVLGLVFILNKEKPHSQIGDLKEGVSPYLNSYSGKAVFNKKILQEKHSRQGGEEPLPLSNGNTDADIEVSTKEQLVAMKEMLDKVRADMATENEEIASGNAKHYLLLPKPEATPRQFDINNFVAPRDLISVIPKALQGTY